MFKNFTILKHRTCKLKLFIALTGKTVSFTFSLFLHHCYHHKTLSYSHLLFSLVFSCIIFSLTVTCAGQDDLCIQYTGIYVKKVFFPCTRALRVNSIVGRTLTYLDLHQGLWCRLEGGKNGTECSLNIFQQYSTGSNGLPIPS